MRNTQNIITRLYIILFTLALSFILADGVIMMTSGPKAQIGDVLTIPLEHPRIRREVIEHPDYYHYRGHLINFLEN